MAESGGSNDREPDNPFSFQKFVKKKDQVEDEEDVEDEPVNIQLPDVSSSTSENTAPDGGGSGVKKVGAKKTVDENPFSFKKFLKTSGGGCRPKRYRGQNGAGLTYASDLPDFVQDHYSTNDNAQERLQFRDPLELPDFALDTSGLSQFGHQNSSSIAEDQGRADVEEAILNSHRVSGNITPPGQLLNLQNGDIQRQPPDINAGSFNELEVKDDGPQLASSLPDFLSDGAISNTENTSGQLWPGYPGITVQQLSSSRNIAAFAVDGDVEIELRRLREENEDLRHQLIKQTKRLSQTQREMETIQKRETEDTAALENMVHQVEANLVTTTQRAVKAESMVAKLKQDLKSVQSQLSNAQRENKLLQSGDNAVMSIRERTKYASEQLSTAATNAEQTLRQLLTGVESMKVLSEVLASIDKVTEVDSPNGSEGQS